MAQRRAVVEETYEEEEVREGLWDRVRGWFGPDEPEMENDNMGSESSLPAKRAHAAPSFFPINSAHRQMRVSIRLNAVTMDHAQEAVDSLKDRNQVILNLENADDGMDRRILDFVSGACYALDGLYQRVGTKVFLFAPSNITIEVEDEPVASAARVPSFLTQGI